MLKLTVPEIRRKYWNDLSAVTTIPEASRLWNIPPTTLHVWCSEGKIASVQPDNGGTWLISVRALIDRCGDPLVPIDDREYIRDFYPEKL
jgi:hypothetical protein